MVAAGAGAAAAAVAGTGGLAMGPLLALGGASAVAQFFMGGFQARRNNRYLRQLQIQRNQQYLANIEYQRKLMEFYTKRYQETAKSAMADADQQYSTVFDAIGQRRAQAAGTVERYTRQAAQASGRFRTTNTETAGQSKRLVLDNFARNEAAAASVIHDNLEGFMRQSQRRLASIRATAQNRINAAMPAPMQPIFPGEQVQAAYAPGGMDLAMSLANVYASTYAQTQSLLPNNQQSFSDINQAMFSFS